MKQIVLVMAGVLLLTGCQSRLITHIPGFSQAFFTPLHPAILELQLLTGEARSRTGKWPLTPADYEQTFGDSIRTLFNNFQSLAFAAGNDTLVIRYWLADSIYSATSITFADRHPPTETPQFTIQETTEKGSINLPFRPGEGRLQFIQLNGEFFVRHEFAGGATRNSWKK